MSASLKNDTLSDTHHYPSKACQHKHINMMIFQLIKVYLITKKQGKTKISLTEIVPKPQIEANRLKHVIAQLAAVLYTIKLI
jgi:hypothetical protein